MFDRNLPSNSDYSYMCAMCALGTVGMAAGLMPNMLSICCEKGLCRRGSHVQCIVNRNFLTTANFKYSTWTFIGVKIHNNLWVLSTYVATNEFLLHIPDTNSFKSTCLPSQVSFKINDSTNYCYHFQSQLNSCLLGKFECAFIVFGGFLE